MKMNLPDRSPPWLFLRALGLIFATAFASLWTQIDGLVGPQGIAPVGAALDAVAGEHPGLARFWAAPTLLWLSQSSLALWLLCAAGLLAGLALTFNLRPRLACAVATVCYLSFICVAGEFAHYQSDGMLLEAGTLSFFLLGSAAPLVAPDAFPPAWTAWRNRLAQVTPARAALWLLRWEWFRLYFESGFIKWFGGDPQWHALTALDRYYENGPLPTWLAWYAQQELPHGFHAACAAFTLLLENLGPLVLFLPWRNRWARRARLTSLALCTMLQLGILATANYAFINHLALALGLLLLDDEAVRWLLVKARGIVPLRLRLLQPVVADGAEQGDPGQGRKSKSTAVDFMPATGGSPSRPSQKIPWVPVRAAALGLLGMMFWTTLLLFPRAPLRALPAWTLEPAVLLEPFRIANRFGLFGRMTDARYELEFQGSSDGEHWTAYPFRRKPQDVHAAPGIYAPHQPRFDWNLWFASLGEWRDAPWTLSVCEAILQQRQPVLALFAENPLAQAPPTQCRIVRWQYWFTTPAEKAAKGAWWRRERKGVWAPVLELQDGQISIQPEQ